MTATATDRLALETLHASRQLISAMGALRMSMQFDQPQTWTLAMLRRRWPALADEAIAQLARDRLGFVGEAGDLTLMLDEVIACDAEIAARLRARRTTPDPRKISL